MSMGTLPLETLSMIRDLIHPIASIQDSCIFHLKRDRNSVV